MRYQWGNVHKALRLETGVFYILSKCWQPLWQPSDRTSYITGYGTALGIASASAFWNASLCGPWGWVSHSLPAADDECGRALRQAHSCRHGNSVSRAPIALLTFLRVVLSSKAFLPTSPPSHSQEGADWYPILMAFRNSLAHCPCSFTRVFSSVSNPVLSLGFWRTWTSPTGSEGGL